MKNSILSARVHRSAQACASALLALAALGASCGPPCLKSLPTPSAQRAANRATAAAPAFDLLAAAPTGAASGCDLNGILKNPLWQYQQGTDPDSAGVYALKDAEQPEFNCFSGNNWFTDPRCTSQAPRCDLPENPFKKLICTLGNTKFNGHMNWRPATYEGAIFWDQQATDGDLDFLFYPPKRAGMTQASCDQRHGAIGVEFDSREVNDEMRAIKQESFWWRRFIAAVDQQNEASATAPSEGPKNMIEGKFAILTGLLGLDCEHGCTAEIHPVWALALHAEDNPNDDEWAIFARNWGDEGFCSAQQHYLNLPTDKYILRLPWRPQATAVEVLTEQSSYCLKSAGSTPPVVTFKPGEAVFVTFTLSSPQSKSFALGDLHLKWVNGLAGEVHPPVGRDERAQCPATPTPVPLAATARPQELRAEKQQAGDKRLAAIINEMKKTPELGRKYDELNSKRAPRSLKAADPRALVAANEELSCAPFGSAQLSQNGPPAPTSCPASGAQVSNLRLAAAPADAESKAVCTALGDKAKTIGDKLQIANLDKACKQLLKRP